MGASVMEYRMLGKTGIRVSRLCFGGLIVGPVQQNLPPDVGGEVMAYAIERGINFFDTAELYGTYEHIRHAMRRTGRYDIVISTKTYAYNRELAHKAVEDARRALDRDVIDIFMLHEQESIHTLRGHAEALDTLFEYKAKGILRAVGASTHRVAGVEGVIAKHLDVLHPLLNVDGLGISDGNRAQMEDAVRRAHEQGIGVFTMKALGGGNLFRRAEEAFRYILSFDGADAVAVGMQHIDEVAANLRFFEDGCFLDADKEQLARKSRRLHIDDWCVGCGACAERCGQHALRIEGGQAVCDSSRCILCGYCSRVCPEWAIKIH